MSLFRPITGSGDWFNAVLTDLFGEPERIEGYDWQNMIYSSGKFRRAHVELFSTEKLMVLHVTVFPHYVDPAPIYGFDIVSGKEKCAAAFLDLSPTMEEWGPLTNSVVGKPRDVPEWASSIFSKNAISTRPENPDDVYWILRIAEGVFRKYLSKLGSTTGDPGLIKEAQDAYCMKQRQNDKTKSALSKIIGEEEAEKFINNILFPIDP